MKRSERRLAFLIDSIAGFARSPRRDRGSRRGRDAIGLLCIAALAVLCVATLVYVFDRPPGTAYWIPASLVRYVPGRPLFGAAGDWLPSFSHAFAFSVFAVALWPAARGRRWLAPALWFAIGSALEAGQHPALARSLNAALPQWFGTVPVLDHLGRYWLQGSFAWADLLALAAGCAAAGWLVSAVEANRPVSKEDRHAVHE